MYTLEIPLSTVHTSLLSIFANHQELDMHCVYHTVISYVRLSYRLVMCMPWQTSACPSRPAVRHTATQMPTPIRASTRADITTAQSAQSLIFQAKSQASLNDRHRGRDADMLSHSCAA